MSRRPYGHGGRRITADLSGGRKMDRGPLLIGGGGLRVVLLGAAGAGGAGLGLNGVVGARFAGGGGAEGSMEMKRLERVCVTIKRAAYSPRSEEAYAQWIVQSMSYLHLVGRGA